MLDVSNSDVMGRGEGGATQRPRVCEGQQMYDNGFPAWETGESSIQWEATTLPLDWRMPANCPPLCRWPFGMAPNLSGWTLPPSTHVKPRPPPTNQRVNTASWLHTATRDFTEAPRRWMQFWDKLGCVELCAMDQIQVNIPPLLLLVAVECKPCLWSEESVCVDMRPPANPVRSAPSSQPGH